MRWFVLAINPEPWAVGPAGVARKNGKLVPYIGRNQQLAEYQEAIREAIGPIDESEIIKSRIRLVMFFWRHRADWQTPQARRARKNEADDTNMLKATEDALQGLLFINDKDTNDIRGVIVEQGPDVVGKIVLGIEASAPIPLAISEIPPNIWDLAMGLNSIPKATNNEWRGPNG